jgi:hypothetical protein
MKPKNPLATDVVSQGSGSDGENKGKAVVTGTTSETPA